MTDADIGALAQRLLDQNGRPQPSSSTEKAAKPTIDDALVSQVLSAVRQLTPEERETPAALANPDAVRKYSFLANLLSAAYDNGGDVSPPLATAIIDTLADMGRAEAVNLLPHLASESRRVADAVLAAQAVFDTTVDVPQRTIDEISAPFAWPTPSGPCLPTADYTCGWAQWGLSAAMSLSSNPRARQLRARLRLLLLPSWEAAALAAGRLPPRGPGPAQNRRMREAPATTGPPAKNPRPATQRCLLCPTPVTTKGFRYCAACFRKPPAQPHSRTWTARPSAESPAATPAAPTK